MGAVAVHKSSSELQLRRCSCGSWPTTIHASDAHLT